MRTFWIPAMVAALALSACGNTTDSSAPAARTASVATAPATASAAAQHPRRGPFGMIQRALASLDLTAEQRAQVAKLAAAAQARHASMGKLRQELTQAVAAQIEDGRVNRVALQPKIDALTAAWETAAPADRAALEQLHSILTPAQRGKLVDTIMAGAHERMGRHHGGRGHMRKLFADLGLTAEQQQQIREAMHARHPRGKHERGLGPMGHERGLGPMGPMGPMKARGAKLAEAFRGDTFKMDDVAPRGMMKKMGHHGGDRIIGMAETLLPLLTPAQRVGLAAKIRSHALPPPPDAE